MRDQLYTMLDLQDAMNTKVLGEDWQRQAIPMHRALWVEAGELMESFGYKWWKGGSMDLEACQMELIDMFHFMLSMSLTRWDKSIIVDQIEFAFEEPQIIGSNEQFRKILETIVHDAIEGKIRYDSFIACAEYLELDSEEIFLQYCSKNVLNRFRQDYGYKEGTYVKDWNGQEDSMKVLEVARMIHYTSSFCDELYEVIADYYVEVVL